jgi:hypothetical protein
MTWRDLSEVRDTPVFFTEIGLCIKPRPVAVPANQVIPVFMNLRLEILFFDIT